jgi:hypothetical protein
VHSQAWLILPLLPLWILNTIPEIQENLERWFHPRVLVNGLCNGTSMKKAMPIAAFFSYLQENCYS